ncbi:hypothetical protein Dda_5223 [Drechslerella dactyloides]|uniref:Adenosine deaminase domain-containing protein n=1 Tax=Drechslerella dactyloides TaxID=74499 RepID=A0AAD6NIL7_DREDA|nr:hypothetical protein Dda_5223 [Drechslerella dactyloides]
MAEERWQTLVPPFFASLPKCELHVHLEGTLEPEAVRNLAERNGFEPPDIFDGDGNYKPFFNMEGFRDIHRKAITCVQTPEDIADIYLGYLERARCQGIMHAEISFNPQIYRRRNGERIPLTTILEGIQLGRELVTEMEAETNAQTRRVSVRMIMCFLRDRPIAEADTILTELLDSPFKSFVAGVGLEGNDKNHPPIKFKDVFARAKEAGLKTTMHCDINLDNSIKHIRQAVHDVGVDRIDHGLTCCPTSNFFVVPDFKRKDIMSLLNQGVLITINSDNPGFMGGYLTGNFYKMFAAGLSKEELIQAAMNSISMSWVSDQQKQQMSERLHLYIREYALIEGRDEDELRVELSTGQEEEGKVSPAT